MINKLAAEVHANAVAKGFYEQPKNIGEILCLIHSEVSEALEADRRGIYATANAIQVNAVPFDGNFIESFGDHIKDTFEDELADIVIRVMDLAAYKGIDLENHIKAKMRYNATRGYKHGKKY
jgi:NTP pyrophosphatase (non-canonical NTP hydrolase)